jgi:hypothetical protein
MMVNEPLLKEIAGLQTVKVLQEKLGYSRQATINLVSRLKREGHASRLKGKGVRIYRITVTRQRTRDPGMFDIINKYSPFMKLSPWYDHQVHGRYGPEEALVDAVQTRSFRVILASLRLFSHIRDWKKLYTLAKEKDCWQQIGALHDLAGKYYRVKRIPQRYANFAFKKKKYLIRDYETKEPEFLGIEERWNVAIPFRKGDLAKVEA